MFRPERIAYQYVALGLCSLFIYYLSFLDGPQTDECISYKHFAYPFYVFCLCFNIKFICFNATLAICAYLCMIACLGTKEQDLEQIRHQKSFTILLQEKQGRVEAMLLPV